MVLQVLDILARDRVQPLAADLRNQVDVEDRLLGGDAAGLLTGSGVSVWSSRGKSTSSVRSISFVAARRSMNSLALSLVNLRGLSVCHGSPGGRSPKCHAALVLIGDRSNKRGPRSRSPSKTCWTKGCHVLTLRISTRPNALLSSRTSSRHSATWHQSERAARPLQASRHDEYRSAIRSRRI
jgi:hypothetical protein